MSIGKGGQRNTQKSQSGVDAPTSDYLQQMWQSAQGAGAAGPSSLVTDASGYYGGAMKAGNLGMGALSGDPSAVKSLMDPYQQQVIGAMRDEAGVTDQRTMNAVNDRATAAGAFGGTRHGVATGTALAANNRALNTQIGGLLSSGYGDAMNRAGQLAGMGYNAAGANANLGMGGVGNPDQWRMEMMRRGFIMPTGQQSSGSSAGVYANASFDPLKMFQTGGG